MPLKRPCLDCGTRTSGSRCTYCTQRRDHARNRSPAQRARLSITTGQRHRVYTRDGYRCQDCGAGSDLTLDHVIPLADEVAATYTDDELVASAARATRGRER